MKFSIGEFSKITSLSKGSSVECLVVITLEPKAEDWTLVNITESDWSADFEGVKRYMGQVEG
jgi:hypothetical protein